MLNCWVSAPGFEARPVEVTSSLAPSSTPIASLPTNGAVHALLLGFLVK